MSRRAAPKRTTARNAAATLRAGAAAALGTIALAFAMPPAKAAQYAKPVSTQLNPTGKTVRMPVPLKSGGEDLGEVLVLLRPDDSVEVQKSVLVKSLSAVLEPAAAEALAALPEEDGNVDLDAIRAAGLDARFDPNALELVIEPTVDQRAENTLSLDRGRGEAPVASAARARPALFSTYLNMYFGIDYRWDWKDEAVTPRLDFDSASRIGEVVLENSFGFDPDGSVLCPIGAVCRDNEDAGFYRRESRLVYDYLPSHLRFIVGDTEPLGTSFQSSPEMLGFSVEHAPRKLAPRESRAAAGSSSFRIDQSSTVDVFINGQLVRQLRLRPGIYNLTDIPLQTGANAIELRSSEDGSGATQTLTYSTFFDGSLLAPGKNEWAVTGGIASYMSDKEREYHDDQWIGTAYLRMGLTEEITGTLHLQGDERVVMGGSDFLMATPIGFFAVSAALSDDDGEFGYAANATWAFGNTQIFAYGSGAGRESLTLSAEYRSDDFRVPGQLLAQSANIVYPQVFYTWRFSSTYSVALTDRVSASLSGRYSVVNEEAAALAVNSITDDRYGVALTLSSALSPTTNASLSIGYSNESITADDIDPEFRLMARFYLRPDAETNFSASYDTLDRASRVSAHHAAGNALNRWNASVDLAQVGDSDESSVVAGTGYSGNRFEGRVSHSAQFDDAKDGYDGPSQVTTAEIGTALAFADGRFAWGAPVRGGGFAIIHPHASIADHEISVGTLDDPQAVADMFGPALVGDLPAYSQTTLPVDGADLPVGYSLGQAGFDISAPYRAGYALQVGSDRSVSAYGTLIGSNGEPIALLTGIASPEDDPATQVIIFTNAAGRFGAEGLGPGRWLITMDTEPEVTRFTLDVPEGTEGLFRAGTLQPEGG